MSNVKEVDEVILTRLAYKLRFTGKSLPTFSTGKIVDGEPLEDGHYTALVGEIFNVFSLDAENDKYIGLRAQVDHDDMYLILSLENYDKYIETGIFDIMK